MTITRDAISFASGGREIGVAPIATIQPLPGRTMLVRTRLGSTYRFRLRGADHLCRLAAAPAPAECFSRNR